MIALGPAVSRWRARLASMLSPLNVPRRVVMSLVDFDRRAQRLEYTWICTDGGRATSSRPKQRQDCTVRALAIACSLPYDDAYDLLKEAGRKCNRGFQFSTWLNHQDWAARISFPAIKGQRRMNPSTFVRKFPKGRFICQVAKHVFVVIDGVVFDAFENRPDRCIYTAWEIKGSISTDLS